MVGKLFQIFAAKHDRTRIIRGIDIELRPFFLYVDLFLLHVDVERNVELRDLASWYVHVVLHKNSESLRIRRDSVFARREVSDFSSAAAVGGAPVGFAARYQHPASAV